MPEADSDRQSWVAMLPNAFHGLPPTHRSHVLSELVMDGGIEGIETATNIALSDGDTEVKVAVRRRCISARQTARCNVCSRTSTTKSGKRWHAEGMARSLLNLR